ncbi:E3 ubiquitin/ISG15 ligase TRIM25-like [Chanos chanos]|uniref:E3 ubiquitin/ISG15 ligase TRIM25-like n=1 Tax=Chanos chanos TaxID=29144 RepID=A0A6J2V9K1_CHACN|nr:E3 ubiquitin/ISG15 ligase TRIM25-like [Chanos chanos]
MGSLEEEHTCQVCRDLFSRAHPLPCGHSFCPACVRETWSQSRGSRAERFLCPQCQEEDVVVACDCCPAEGDGGPASAAVKTCLRCEVSLCQEHLQPHLVCPAYSTHLLVEPLGDLSRRRCSDHQEVFRYYCADDQEYVCTDCMLEGSHKQHRVKRLRKVEEDYRGMLQMLLQKAEDKVQLGEKILQEHQNFTHTIEDSSTADEYQVERLGVALQAQVEELVVALREVTKHEREQAIERLKEESGRVRGDLKLTESIQRYLGSLLEERDPFLLIWAFQSDDSKLVADLSSPVFSPKLPSLDKKRVLENVENKYHEFISETLRCLVELKRDLLSSPLTLDPNSAHPLLKISDDLKSAVRVKTRLSLSAHPDRFDHWSQVVTIQSFSSGTHYWELEAEGFWDIAVTYHSVPRKGKDGTAFGCNEVSWSLTQQHDKKLTAWHNRKKKRLSAQMSGNRVAVSLDYAAGSITFSEVGPSSTLIPLHNFSTTFVQPVCLGFGLYKPELNSRVSIVKKM